MAAESNCEKHELFKKKHEPRPGIAQAPSRNSNNRSVCNPMVPGSCSRGAQHELFRSPVCALVVLGSDSRVAWHELTDLTFPSLTPYIIDEKEAGLDCLLGCACLGVPWSACLRVPAWECLPGSAYGISPVPMALLQPTSWATYIHTYTFTVPTMALLQPTSWATYIHTVIHTSLAS